MKRWAPLTALAMAQFVMVLDQSVMNVSISALVDDFDTTVSTIQGVITLYCLVMALFMLTGAKIGDIIGRRRAFVVGLSIYAAGSALTAVAPTVGLLALGRSVTEGLGAALVLPALAALIAGNFEGDARKAAYAVIGGVAGAGIAVGPILGGWATTTFTWRIVFVFEVILVGIILVMSRFVADAKRTGTAPRLDFVGTVALLRGPRCDRSRDVAVEHVGMDPAQGVPDHPFRLLVDHLRDHARRDAHLGLRVVAAASGGEGIRSAGAHEPAAGSAAAFRTRRPVHPEPDPHGCLLRRPSVPATGPRARRVADRSEDAVGVHHDVRGGSNGIAVVQAVPGAGDRSHRSGRQCRRSDHAPGDHRAHAGRVVVRVVDGCPGRRHGLDRVPTG